MKGGKKDRKDYFEVPYAALRCLVEPAFSERSVMTHSSHLKKAKVVISTAKITSSTQIITDDGEIVPYDFLVICTGSSYTGPRPDLSEFKSIGKVGGLITECILSLSLSLSL
jgi:NADH dehydrogenase FAD-containing subunit